MKKQKIQNKSQTEKSEKKLSRFELLGLSREKEMFVENLAMLFSSGVDVYYALESLKNESKNKGMKKLIAYIQQEISQGYPIWKAFENTKFFPSHVISLVRIGEQSGRLPQNLQLISSQQQKERVFRSKIKSAMMYPVFVLMLSAIIGLGISWFILPKLASVFSSLKMELPAITKALIGAGIFMGKYGTFFVPIALVLMFLVFYFIFFFSKTKFIGQTILLHTPGIGTLIKEVEIGRFGYLLGTLLEAGVPVLNSLESIESASTVGAYKKLYGFLREKVSEGNSFQKSFSLYKKSEKLIPSYIQNMVFAGEKSGNFPKTLVHVGKVFEEKTETTTKNLAVILEPVLLVVVWLGVVFIALAVILPIYNLIGGLNSNKNTNSSTPAPPPAEEIIVPDNPVENMPIENSQPEQPATDGNIESEVSSEVIEQAGTISILETGVGFLNVRDLPSIEGKIISKIKPGTEYKYFGKQEDWYEIIISENETGWVTAEYVKEIPSE